MKRASLATIIGVVVLYGCDHKQELTLKYNQLGNVSPVVHPGDTLTWKGTQPNWDGTSPCIKDSKPCTVKGKPHGSLYSYDCDQDPKCDPEILVDDGVDKTERLVKSNEVSIRVFCDQGKSEIKKVDRDMPVQYGQIVHWLVVGDESGDANPVKVNFKSATDQDNVCMEASPSPIDGTHDCTVKMNPMKGQYKVTVASCSESLYYGSLGQ